MIEMSTDRGPREIAADWHSGQWSALYAFSSSGAIQSDLASEIESCLRMLDERAAAYDLEDIPEMREELRELLAFVTQPVTAVWSAYGHHFGDSDGGYESCWRCGGEWELVRDHGAEDPSHGAYVSPSGDEAMPCEGPNGYGHGEDRAEDAPPCNCVICHG